VAYRRTPAVLQQQADVRARITTAAHALVSEHGWAGCTVTAVARGAGIGTGSVYTYFARKDDLLAEVFRQAGGREVAAFRDAADAADAGAGCPCEGLVAAIRTFADRAARAPRLAYALLAEPVDVAAVDVERLAFRAAYADLLAVRLRALLPGPDADVTAAALIGAVSEVLLVPLARGPFDADGYTRTVDSLVSHAQRSLGGQHEQHAPGHQPGPPARRVRRR
jgi:AcrR family transcriptional regulator